ncbi:transporter substrate-binding domain-containing protein [Nesterenkonia halotolerans]|uniref:Polar amino acid transport system substrate-binding protein n=1 Tax=Nesterenkonia halotolerans TaxID=225325 RepID=A0ABR9J6D2_9MICC|nr:transporter substrate-binding domain-containing protein [Nesterenkonia halotolerans]MBE1514550.1 polar amino acid transport system substrate-binding protein [Nesterenkonia halotolerans]
MRNKTSMAVRAGAVSAAALLALTACGGDDAESDEAAADSGEETITVAINGEEPYSYITEEGEQEGATIALAEEIFGEMGYSVEAELVPDWDSLIPGLGAERYDAVSAGMSITPERCAEASFAEPEIMYTTALLVEEGNPYGVENLNDVAEAMESGEDITLATLSSGIEATYVEELGIDAEGVGSADDGMDMVTGGRADVFALTAISLSAMAEDTEGVEVTEGFVHDMDGTLQYGAGSTVFPQDSDMLEEYNEHLAELKESGELLEIIGEYGFTEAEIPPADLTAEALCEGDLESLQDIED